MVFEPVHDPIRRSQVKRAPALFAAVLSLAAVSAFAAPAKFTGYISDEMCGAKHAGTGAACAKKCIEGGEKPVFVDAASKTVYKIDNPDTVKAFYGSKVDITAEADAAGKSVHITAIDDAK
jgi:hypothetical protein